MWNQLPNLNDVSTLNIEPLIDIIIYQSNNKTLTVKFIRKKIAGPLGPIPCKHGTIHRTLSEVQDL
jgi:hypothetical protein